MLIKNLLKLKRGQVADGISLAVTAILLVIIFIIALAITMILSKQISIDLNSVNFLSNREGSISVNFQEKISILTVKSIISFELNKKIDSLKRESKTN